MLNITNFVPKGYCGVGEESGFSVGGRNPGWFSVWDIGFSRWYH